jgi:hypothetical protein
MRRTEYTLCIRMNHVHRQRLRAAGRLPQSLLLQELWWLGIHIEYCHRCANLDQMRALVTVIDVDVPSCHSSCRSNGCGSLQAHHMHGLHNMYIIIVQSFRPKSSMVS